MKHWIPSIEESKLLYECSELRKVGQIVRGFPWPFSPREFILCSSGMLVKERKAVLLMSRSLT